MKPRVCFIASAIVAFAAVPLAALDADRDFSGKWMLDPQASRLSALPGPPERMLAIVHSDAAIRCSATGDDGAAAEWTFSSDGNESKYRLGPERRNTVAKWEGSALLITTIVSEPSNYSVMDRWKLSADRATLTIERQIVRATGEVEGTAVYRREGQTQLTVRPTAPAPPAGAAVPPRAPAAAEFAVRAGTRIPLQLINTLNTKASHEGDGVYLETAIPVFVEGRLVIPRGSYVRGTITTSKPAGHAKGKAEMYIRFDTLTLPNGVTREFRSRLGSADAGAKGQVDPAEGTIRGEDRGPSSAGTVARGAGTGATVGSIAGAASGHWGTGIGLGGAVGGLAGLASVLGSRGPGVSLPRGTTMEMVLDRDLVFKPEDLRF